MSKKNSIFAENFAKMPKDIAFILYNTPEHSEKVQVVIREETLWMTQKAMAELFGCSPDNISLHLKNIYEAGELQAEATSEKISVVQTEGSRQVNRATLFYDLDAIISVGYRVNSVQAEEKAEHEYEVFNKTQLIESDFDKEVKHLLEK